MSPVIELHDVRKTYPGPVEVLHGIDLTIERDEQVAILGPSGSGKSTLLNLIGILDRPTSGTLVVNGQDTAALTDGRLAGLRATTIGFVFQQFFLLDYRTALDNVADGLLYTATPLRERRRRAAEVLDRVGLGGRFGHRPAQLSGGERQRVAIARALVGRPTLVLADEPTGALDTANGAAVLELLGELHDDGTTLIVITHDPSVAAAMDREIHIRDGRIHPEPT
ncbi:ABC transporter ATP-binding protein [Actinoallomurus bryophytorum]|uniref:Putative ABC transport system ATP-binding protein n=1 Tax=Actinoallomurus bryophytorum TaxID=1490222 RepID=A0A543CKY2_9ACTN|nr:ABC transporter ATP-binding protein [Actinoallomurus bryophytorum]TQL97764.1 putative ABC transport system ATP-binding protein [Actinoallomurus bryophytorum]